MQNSKRYLHDKIILLLITVGVFLATLGSLLILLRLNTGNGSEYIVQYRSNLGLNSFQDGNYLTFVEFIAFMVINLIISIAISVKIYTIRRIYSVTVLSACILLLILMIIVSNSLLVLR